MRAWPFPASLKGATKDPDKPYADDFCFRTHTLLRPQSRLSCCSVLRIDCVNGGFFCLVRGIVWHSSSLLLGSLSHRVGNEKNIMFGLIHIRNGVGLWAGSSDCCSVVLVNCTVSYGILVPISISGMPHFPCFIPSSENKGKGDGAFGLHHEAVSCLLFRGDSWTCP